MADGAFLGVDLGTSSAKAGVYDTRGRRLGHAAVEVALDTRGVRAEQDPDQVVEAGVAAVARAVGEVRRQGVTITALGLGAAMHSLLALDGAGVPLTPALTYADNRASTQAAELRASHPSLAVRTGTPLHPMSPLAKLRWFREEEPTIAERAARWVSLKEYFLLRVCGEAVVDYSIASATGLFELAASDWDPQALDLVGLDRSMLSTLVPPTTVLRSLAPVWAERMGLSSDTPVVVGGSDGALANLGAGAVDPGVMALTIGTSGAVRTMTSTPRADPRARLFCYALTGEHWVVGGSVNNGGVVLRWARDQLLCELAEAARADGEKPYVRFDRLAARVPPGADGLLFLPYLLGERAPLWDSAPRGVLFGLATHHNRGHVLRALLEGVAYQLATVAQVVDELTQRATTVRANGGFTSSPLWLQIVADVLDRRLEVPRVLEASSLGAALLAMEALGVGKAVDLARQLVTVQSVVEPSPDASAVHARMLPLFVRVRDQLLGSFHDLAAITAGE